MGCGRISEGRPSALQWEAAPRPQDWCRVVDLSSLPPPQADAPLSVLLAPYRAVDRGWRRSYEVVKLKAISPGSLFEANVEGEQPKLVTGQP